MSLSNLWIHFQRVRREIAVGVRGCRYLCSEIKRIFQTTNTMYVTKSVTIGFSHLPFAFTLRRAAKLLLKLCTIVCNNSVAGLLTHKSGGGAITNEEYHICNNHRQ